MTISIALVGAAGRMGRQITRSAASKPEVSIIAAIEYSGAPSIGKDLGVVAGADPLGTIISDNLIEGFKKADVIVDLSLPVAIKSVVDAAVATNTPLICGTTGLDEKQVELFDKASSEIAVLYTPNLSPGVAVMTALVKKAAQALGPDYDIEIVEMHHKNKVDAPSGTAIAIANAAAQASGPNKEAFCYGRHGNSGVRPEKEIGIHAVRGGQIFGEHAVIFAGDNERIEITHKAASRALFADGALRAATFLVGKPAGDYSMIDVLGL